MVFCLEFINFIPPNSNNGVDETEVSRILSPSIGVDGLLFDIYIVILGFAPIGLAGSCVPCLHTAVEKSRDFANGFFSLWFGL